MKGFGKLLIGSHGIGKKKIIANSSAHQRITLLYIHDMRTHGIEEHQRGVNGCLEGSGSRLLAEGASRNQKTGMLIIMTCNQYRFHISHCHQERLLLLSQTTTDNELSLLILSAFLLETEAGFLSSSPFVQGKREGGQGSRCDLFFAFKRLISLQ